MVGEQTGPALAHRRDQVRGAENIEQGKLLTGRVRHLQVFRRGTRSYGDAGYDNSETFAELAVTVENAAPEPGEHFNLREQPHQLSGLFFAD